MVGRQTAVLLAALLQDQERKLAVAESCTGGAIAAACTALPGSSAWFEGGVVSYSNAAKVALLGVQQLSIEEHGAVSQAVVEQMVAGLCQRLGASCGIATSGVAGPSGGSAEKPVGTVWIATQVDDQRLSHCYRFSGDRASVQRQAVEKSLQSLLQRLTD